LLHVPGVEPEPDLDADWLVLLLLRLVRRKALKSVPMGSVGNEWHDEESDGKSELLDERHHVAAGVVQHDGHILVAGDQVFGDPALVADDQLADIAREISRGSMQVASREELIVRPDPYREHIVTGEPELDAVRGLPLFPVPEQLARERRGRQAVARLAAVGVKALEAPAIAPG